LADIGRRRHPPPPTAVGVRKIKGLPFKISSENLPQGTRVEDRQTNRQYFDPNTALT